MRCGFWPLIQWYVYPWSSQSFPKERTAGVSSRSITVTNKSNSLPTDDEQVARVPKTGEQEKKRAQAGWQSVCSGTTIGSQHSTLFQETPLTAVVPKPSEQRSSATMRTKAKRKHWSLRLVLEPDGWMTWQVFKVRNVFRVKSRLALVQSSIRCRGTRFGNSMDSILSVQNQNFSRNRRELTKVLGADVETTSHLHWQFLGIRQSLWRSLLESLHVYTTPIGD